MIGSFLTRGLVMVFGYAYPAYECFKTVEMNKPDIQQLRFWCQYWILVAMLTVCERFGDAFISWVPMYSEAKLAFFIYLWCPKTKGTTYIYDAFFKPVILKHETEIDRNLLELRTRAGDMLVLYWQKVASYGQTRIYDILQYIASQSNPPPPTQPQRQSSRGRQPTATLNRRSTAPADEQASPASSESSSENEADAIEDAESSKAPPPSSIAAASLNAQKATPSKTLVSTAAASLNAQKTTPSKALAETTKSSASVDTQVMQIDSVPSSANESVINPPPAETNLEEASRVTRARSRKTRAQNP
ncbi:putative HVA22-like protein g [Nicotiana sylvestris]|uniref:HVA22-like protein n=1 Tax=Nicotiana sylvestris TaxID=4096 RepID=A0A1U7WWQ0_NICSY|nr:PREDICTED: putative HVA22-like protein g [Nicotiana sylvestris]